jgi:hypothetical protein
MVKAKQYRRHVRHWREKWSPDAELVFTRRLKLGLDPKKPWVNPGDPVTEKLRDQLGIRKLRTWWNARAVGLKEWAIEKPQAEEVLAGSISVIGGGWYQVTLPDGTEHRVRGKKQAQALLKG